MTLTEFLRTRTAERGTSNANSRPDVIQRLIVLHSEIETTIRDPQFGDITYSGCWNCKEYGQGDEYPSDGPCETLKIMALPYVGHPDFDPSWRI